MSTRSGATCDAGVALPQRSTGYPSVTAATLIDDGARRLCLGGVLRNRALVLSCRRVDELVPLLATHRVDVIIVAPWDSQGERVAPELRAIRLRWPSLPVAVYCALTPAAVREVVALVKAGADDVIFQGIDDVGQTLWSRLFVSACQRAAEEAFAALHPFLPISIEPIVSYCLERAQSGVSVEQVAAALQMHRRTLAHRMAAAGMPAPSIMISWCRLLIAARLLEDPGRAVEQVALALGFSSGAALRNMLRRYTGMRPSELRSSGGLTCVVRRFQHEISPPRLCLA